MRHSTSGPPRPTACALQHIGSFATPGSSIPQSSSYSLGPKRGRIRYVGCPSPLATTAYGGPHIFTPNGFGHRTNARRLAHSLSPVHGRTAHQCSGTPQVGHPPLGCAPRCILEQLANARERGIPQPSSSSSESPPIRGLIHGVPHKPVTATLHAATCPATPPPGRLRMVPAKP